MSTDVHEKTLRVCIDGQEYEFDDPKPLGRQLLDKAGKRPVEEFVIYLFLDNGLMEGIGQDETVDLRKPGIEKFITFETDRIFRFQLDGRSFEWGANLITGLTLKKLAGIDPASHEVWLENRGHGDDRLIADKETVDLSEEGLERFFTLDGHSKEIEVFVNGRKKVVTTPKVSFSEIVALAFDPIPTGPMIIFTITYRHGPHANPEGNLLEGQTVKVKNGMVFNVTYTDKS